MTNKPSALETIRADLAAVPARPWHWQSAAHEGTTSLVAGETPLITTDHEHDPDGCDVDILFHVDDRRMSTGAELADEGSGINNAIARFTALAPAYVAALLAAHDRGQAVAAELAATADLSEVGSDEYITLHAAAARIRGALGVEL